MDTSVDGLLEDLAAHLEDELLKEGIAPEQATDKAVSIVGKIRENWKGQNLYVPVGLSRKLAARDKEIVAKFNGTNHFELAVEHGVSTMRIRQILWRHRDEQRAKSAAKK